MIRGWADANDYIIANSNEAMEKLQKDHYSQTPLADINEFFKAQKMFTFTRLEATLFRRHGHQLVAAVDRLLHGERRYQGLHAGEQIF